jgi:hypothetical protein
MSKNFPIISPESASKIDVFLNTVFEESDKAVEEFNSILYENARKSAKLVKDFHCPKRKELIEKPGFLTLVKIFTTQL